MRLEWNNPDREPELNDLVFEEPEELHRGFLCVGVEEPARRGGRWIVWLERMHWDEWCAASFAPDIQVWSFVRDRRR
jgi:hypothetical protein